MPQWSFSCTTCIYSKDGMACDKSVCTYEPFENTASTSTDSVVFKGKVVIFDQEFDCENIKQLHDEFAAYRALGTVEEIKARLEGDNDVELTLKDSKTGDYWFDQYKNVKRENDRLTAVIRRVVAESHICPDKANCPFMATDRRPQCHSDECVEARIKFYMEEK